MKQQAIQYVALDVHQAIVVVSVRDEQRSIRMRATPTSARLRGNVQDCPPISSCRCGIGPGSSGHGRERGSCDQHASQAAPV